jgi:hypothetical protein
MNRINAESHALNHMERTSLGRPSPSQRVLLASLVTVGLGSVPIQVAYAAQQRDVSCKVDDLRTAIHTAKSGDVLSLAQDCMYALPDAYPQDAALGADGLPVITITLTIKGNGATITRAQGAQKFRIFQVAPGGDLTLSDLTVENGDTSGSDFKAGRGGGIYNLGTVKVINGTISNNNAAVGGGGIGNGDAQEANNVTPAPGNLTLSDNSVVSGNSIASGNGGGIANGLTSTMDLTRCTISGNKGPGIGNQGTAILNKCTVSGNTAFAGAGIFSIGHMILTDSPVTGNAATGQGLGGGGILTVAGGQAAGTTTLVRSPVAGNTSQTKDGGIANFGTMMLIDSPVTGNSATQDGGGIGNHGGQANIGSITLDRSPVTGNRATQDGGGIANEDGGAIVVLGHSPVTGNSAQDGGGIYNQNGNTVTLSNSAVKGNAPNNCTGVSGC